MSEKRELLLEKLSDWILSMDYICHTPEIREMIRQLEKEHGAYQQRVVNIDEN